MNNLSNIYFLHCLTPLHVGMGQGIGAIDMPIMRERTTEWPLVPGSSLKGVMRDYYSSKVSDSNWIHQAFGQSGDREGTAGALVFSDSRILAFPVASLAGTFAYVTCPLVLKRLRRDVEAGDVHWDWARWDELIRISDSLGESDCWAGSEVAHGPNLVLDEFTFTIKPNSAFHTLSQFLAERIFPNRADQTLFSNRLALVSDEVFQYFVTMCCEVIPRIRISEKSKTVENGALWNEEYLPTESILYGIRWCDSRMGQSDQLIRNAVVQIGANTTTGKGRVRYLEHREDF